MARGLHICRRVEILNMKRLATALFAAALLVPAGFAADNKAADKKDEKMAQHNDPYTLGSAAENRIARDVRHELVMLPYYGIFDDLGFNVNGSTVTLLGQVTRPTLKSDAGNVVKRVEGVTNVVN